MLDCIHELRYFAIAQLDRGHQLQHLCVTRADSIFKLCNACFCCFKVNPQLHGLRFKLCMCLLKIDGRWRKRLARLCLLLGSSAPKERHAARARTNTLLR